MAKDKQKPRKPTGSIGPVIISKAPEGARAEFQTITFPRTKDDIEAFIVKVFLKASQQQNILDTSSLKLFQNAIDDFDFTLKTPSG